jgi:hypothetical protein
VGVPANAPTAALASQTAMANTRPTVTATAIALVALYTDADAQHGERPVAAERTAAAVVDPSWKAPRTSWGHPSLEGTWSTDDMRSVPYERPEAIGERAELTPEELAARLASNAADLDRARNRQTFSGRNDVGIRTFGYTSLVVDPPNGRLPPLTEAGRARPVIDGTYGPGPYDSTHDFTLYDRCITRGILGGALPVAYGNGIRIVQTPTSVAISYEMIHDTRIIPLDGRAHVDDDIRLYLGNSRGRWDGDTLVVETRNLTDRTSFGRNGRGPRHSAAMRMTERFTRVDPDMIEYTITAEDPLAYTAPFTVRFMYTTQPGYTIYEYSCHEGNVAVPQALSGERAYERAVADAKAKGLAAPARVPSGPDLVPLPTDEDAFFDINAGE